jgi:protein SCO1/2
VADIPPRLKEYGQKINAKPGWYLVSGKKGNVELALRKLGQFVVAKENHPTVVIIGNVRTGLWKKAFGVANPDELIKAVESVVNDKEGVTK